MTKISKGVLIVLAAWVSLATLWMINVISFGNLALEDCSLERLGLRESDANPTRILPTETLTTEALATEALTTESLLSERLNYYSSKIYSTQLNESEKCTLVIFTSREQEPRVLSHYCNMGLHLQRILVVSSTNNMQPGFHCRVDFKYLQSFTSKVTNRYLPREEIETDCKLFIIIIGL